MMRRLAVIAASDPSGSAPRSPMSVSGPHHRASVSGAPLSGRAPRAQLLNTQFKRARLHACTRREVAMMKTWFNVSEAADYAGVSRDTIYTACERHELRSARLNGRRAIRIRPQWIDAWLEQHAAGGAPRLSGNTSSGVVS